MCELAAREFWICNRAIRNLCTGCFGHLQMSRQEVSMEVCFEHQFDGHAMFCCGCKIRSDVPARVDDDRSASRFVADEVRRLGEALEVVLFENHGQDLPFTMRFLRCAGKPGSSVAAWLLRLGA